MSRIPRYGVFGRVQFMWKVQIPYFMVTTRKMMPDLPRQERLSGIFSNAPVSLRLVTMLLVSNVLSFVQLFYIAFVGCTVIRLIEVSRLPYR